MLFKKHGMLTVFKSFVRHSHNNQGKLRFDGQTAIITGAGRGLGRQYALLLASRGANVVVNDFGGSRTGDIDQDLETNNCAQQVVAEITTNRGGGRAIYDTNSVAEEEGAIALVKKTMAEFGRIDMLINNAGILRDKSFGKMSIDDWDQVIKVHLRGSFLITHLCWPIMQEQKYGRILMTSSTSGLFGNFGQANYAAAKMALIGLSNTLAIEGRRMGVQCNAIVPMAESRMTKDVMPEELSKLIKPAYVAPLAAWLCHRDCKMSGRIFEAAGGWFGQFRLQQSAGKFIGDMRVGSPKDITSNALELLQESWEEVSDFERQPAVRVESFGEHLADLMGKISA